jgi:hypothetical protein
MPDWNPDRELGQGKIKYVIRNAHKGLPVKSVQTGKGELKLDRKGRALVSDASLAAEIRKEHPHDLAVSRVFTNDPADRGHNFFFGQLPEMPWKRQPRDTEAQEGGETAQDEEPAEVEQEG